MATKFIPDELVTALHADLIRRYGGRPGLRDPALLASALAQPKMTSGRRFLHKTLFDKAAAYGFHLCKNHPFIDGNKRVALVVMDVFLQMNGREIGATEEQMYSMMMSLADGTLTKAQLAKWLKEQSERL